MNPSWLVPVQILFLWLMVLVVSLMSPYGSRAHLIAWFLNTLITFLLVLLRPIRVFLAELPRLHQWALGIFFFLFAAGYQFPGMQREVIFPFVPWNMFSMPYQGSEVTYFEYMGIDAAGSRTVINVTQYFPPLRHSRLAASIWQKLSKAKDEPLALDGKHASIKELLIAVAEARNRRELERPPFVAIEIDRCRLDLSKGSPSTVTRKTIGTIKLKSSVA